VTVPATIQAEWTKVRTLRSTLWTLPPTVVAAAGLGWLGATTFQHAQQGNFDPLFATFYGLTLAQLPLVLFGVLLVGSEYSSGTVRAALLATPVRGRLYASKLVAGGLLAAGTALATVAATVAAAQPGLGEYRLSLGNGDVVRTIAGAWLYLTLICLFATGVAWMLRSTAVSLGILLPLLFLGSQGLGNIPKARTVLQYLPDQAGQMIIHIVGPPENPVIDRAYGPWTGIAILALWTAAALAGGYLVFRRRDA
jgi:ABC-2 type transport system permease protein